MTRLIDVDELKKRLHFRNGDFDTQVVTEEDINAMTTVDAVPVVRCKDCIHRYAVDWRQECGNWWCENLDCAVKPEGFCSDGERKEK